MSTIRFDHYRDPDRVKNLATQIQKAARGLERPVRLMEVCGGHTAAIKRFGIDSMLPRGIALISGPGCPVCVTPASYIDAAIEWADRSGGLITTFGDLYRIPGSEASLEEAAGCGLKVKVVYSPADALKIAAEKSPLEVLFLAVGFETTAPAVAGTVEMASRMPRAHFSLMCAHKTMPPALRALLDSGEAAIDGFILPGHVSTVIGSEPYGFLPRDYSVPCCITGFEPFDILRGILSLTEQCAKNEPIVDNRYSRAVRKEGNPKATSIMNRIFRKTDSNWRGLGCIPDSGLDLRDEWAFCRVPGPPAEKEGRKESGCRCGEVLRGAKQPSDCELFNSACTPEKPIGPCMVSSEGACAAFYKYQDF